MIQPTLVNGSWRKPIISGRNKAQLKSYFEQAGVPWIYEKERPEVHETSAYNRRPKGKKHDLNFETRIATIRKNLSTQDDRLEKLRQERYDNMPLKGIDRTIFLAMKSLNFEASGAKKGAAQRRAEAAKERDAAKEMGLTVAKKSPAKGKGKGTSRGGLINKKTKASFELSGASIQEMEDGKGVSTQAAKSLQEKSKEGKQQFRKEK